MAISWAHVVEVAPELATVPPGMRAATLEDVALQVNAAAWGARYDLGCKLLAAHLATVAQRGGAGPAGAIASESVGDVSVSYATAASPPAGSGLEATTYGREFARLSRLTMGRLAIVI